MRGMVVGEGGRSSGVLLYMRTYLYYSIYWHNDYIHTYSLDGSLTRPMLHFSVFNLKTK